MKHLHSLTLWSLIALVVLLSGLFVEASLDVAADHATFTSGLRQLRSLDAQIDQEVLAARFNLSRSYDALAHAVSESRERAESLAIPRFLTLHATGGLKAHLGEYRDHLLQKADQVERFKSRNAVFRNSVDYFPNGIAQLSRKARAQGAGPMAGDLDELLQSSLLYMQTSDQVYAREVAAQLAHIEERRSAYPAELRDQALGNLLLHGYGLLKLKPEIDQLLRDILNSRVDEDAEQVFMDYSQAYVRQQAAADRYQFALYIAALVLLAYVLFMAVRLRNTSRELKSANREMARHLEELRIAEQAQRLYGEVFRNSAEGIMITDAQRRIVEVNQAFTRITGYQPDEVKGKTPRILHSNAHSRAFYQRLWEQLQEKSLWAGEIWNRRKNGKIYPQWLSITTLHDAEGTPTHYIGVFSDISERKEIEERLKYLAEHDVLTGLPNRTLAQDRLVQALAFAQRDRKGMVGLMFVDLDRFKVINDTLGHDYGDEVLRVVAGRLRGLIRASDTISRQGGDEFLVILPQLASVDDAAQIAQKIIQSLAQPFELNGTEMTITSSVGIAIYPDDGETPPILMRNADTAMYRAKALGRNRFCYYRAEMNAASMENLRMEGLLRHAVSRRELVLHYQPQLDCAAGGIYGVEALLRWRSPDLGMVPPDRFIPIAEETGLISAIGHWVLEEACRWGQALRARGEPALRVAVNLSARQFADPGLADQVAQVLQSTGFPAHLLELELTESALMHNLEAGQHTLQRLKSLGVSLAVDDFGTGYSSLAYLQRFPLDKLKIDRSFVTGVASRSEDETIANAIIVLAHALGLKVVAEGVENEAQRDVLKALGCDLLQGFFISRPVPGSEIPALLSGSKAAG